jgi:hypothetical protein
MRVGTLLEVLHAAHYTWLVESPWEERGGIMLVAPPGQLKTTLVYTLEKCSEACTTSDINMISMKGLRDLVLAGRYKTICFGELEKLYARNPATAANIESHLKQFVEEGLRHFSHENSSVPIMPARALVIGAITPSAFGRNFTVWNENGFLRRFLRIQYVLKDEEVILNAVQNWKKIGLEIPIVINGNRAIIPYNLDSKESKFVMTILKEQPFSTPNVLLKRIAVVLKHSQPKRWREIITDLSPACGRNGALLEL